MSCANPSRLKMPSTPRVEIPYPLVVGTGRRAFWKAFALLVGAFTEALEMRQQALDIARKIGSQKDVIGALMNIANIQATSGRTSEAVKNEREAIAIAREIGDNVSILHHFHVSEPDLAPLGTGGVDHAAFAAALRQNGYDRTLAIEMRQVEPFDPKNIEEAIGVARRYYFST